MECGATGTARGGRITKADVLAATDARPNGALGVQPRLTQDRIVRALVEPDDDAIGSALHHAAVLDELAVESLGRRHLEALQLPGQPAIAPVGQDGHRHVQIHIEADLTRQAVQVKEVDADPQ